MAQFKAAFINELFKISKKKKITAAAVLCLAVIALGAVVSCLAGSFLGLNLTGRSEFSIMLLPIFNYVIIPLFTIFICIEEFGGEYTAGTTKTTLLSPVSRFKIFSAKICSMGAFILAFLIFAMLVSFITALIIRQTELNIIGILGAYLISFLPLLVVGLMAALISNTVRGSGAAFMLCLIVYLVLKALELLNPAYSIFFFTSGLNMYILLSAPLISFAKIFRIVAMLFGYGIMLFCAGYFLFDRKNI